MRHILLGLGMACLLSACGDPLRNVTRLGDVTVADGAASVAQSPAETRTTGGGLFSRLLNREPDDPTNAAVDAALAATPAPSAEPTLAAVAAQPETAPRRGLAGFFRRNPDAGPVSRSGPDARDVPKGATLPFGEIARVCGLRANELGAEINNASGYRVYDSFPNSTAPRPFYITGFDDNCARTFTGAVVIPGDAETHEFVRYRPSNERIDYSTSDNAYEALKASVCRVGRGQPCGERTERLNRNTQFITVYNFFGGTFSAVPTTWAQILVHDGRVLAMSIKDGT